MVYGDFRLVADAQHAIFEDDRKRVRLAGALYSQRHEAKGVVCIQVDARFLSCLQFTKQPVLWRIFLALVSLERTSLTGVQPSERKRSLGFGASSDVFGEVMHISRSTNSSRWEEGMNRHTMLWQLGAVLTSLSSILPFYGHHLSRRAGTARIFLHPRFDGGF